MLEIISLLGNMLVMMGMSVLGWHLKGQCALSCPTLLPPMILWMQLVNSLSAKAVLGMWQSGLEIWLQSSSSSFTVVFLLCRHEQSRHLNLFLSPEKNHLRDRRILCRRTHHQE